MTATIPTGNSQSQIEKFLSEIRLGTKGLIEWRMGKKKNLGSYKLQLGTWLAIFDIDQGEAAKIAGCLQPYISSMISGRKTRPNILFLLRLSEAMEITVNDLYQRPPSELETAALGHLSSKAQQTLLRRHRKRA